MGHKLCRYCEINNMHNLGLPISDSGRRQGKKSLCKSFQSAHETARNPSIQRIRPVGVGRVSCERWEGQQFGPRWTEALRH
jgi:hypothetical protein